LALDFQHILLFSKIEPVDDKGIRRSRRMQGLPPEGYQPLPPNPPEYNYHGEVENQSDTGSVVTPPLEKPEGTLVMVENPTPHTMSVSTIPLEPLLLHLDSPGNVIDKEVPQLPVRDFTDTYMGSTEPSFGDEYRTPIRPTTTVDTNPTLACSVWRTLLGHDLCENFESFRQPFNPHDPPVETGPYGQTMNHSIDQVINLNVALTQFYPNGGIITSTHSQVTSIPTPAFTNFHSTDPHVSHDLAGTSFHSRMQTLASQIQPTEGNHHLTDLSLLEDNHPMAGLPLPRDNPFFMFFLEGNLPFPVIPQSLIHHWHGDNLRLLETLQNPREYLSEAHLPNSMLGGTRIITHKEEYQILFLPDYLMDNLIWAASQTPPGVLKDNNLIFPMGLMCIQIQDLLLTLLKGTMFILFLGKQIIQLIMIRTHQVM
jgi:hypothetical protein